MRERLTKLFEFLKAYTDLRYPPVRDINSQLGTLWLKDLPMHVSVELFRDVGKPDDESEDSDIVLRLTRPITTPCPPPPEALLEWLKLGWREYRGAVGVETTRNVVKDGKTRIERFEDNPQRPALLRGWQKQRDLWVANERPARLALTFFQTIYEWYGVQEREGERIELLVGEGLLQSEDVAGDFRHPVLLQKLELEFFPEKKQPQFVFRKREQPPELYMEFLRALPNVNNQQIARCADELKKAEFAPLGGEDTDGFLRRLIQGLFPSAGTLVEHDEQQTAAGAFASSTANLPLFSQPRAAAQPASPTIQRQPLIFMRQRRTGPGGVFDASLNQETDLKPGDYRRKLIEHALDPNAWERELRKRMERTESIFEERVLRRLMEAHYNALPQFQVGAYRIDLVVTGNGRRLAVECDGERYHGPEKLQEDAERQAILERLGWKFVRIRGSLFFRDEERALNPMFGRLAELNITPELKPASKPATNSELVDRVIRRAQELKTSWHLA